MADDAATGDGPGKGYVPSWGIVGAALYLVLLSAALVSMLLWVWPSCEAPADAARYNTALMVTSISPSIGKVNDAVKIDGTGFVDGAKVNFDDTPAVDVKFVSPTTLTARSPAHKAGRVDIVVSNPDSKAHTLAGGFIYVEPQAQLPKPTISALAPGSGPLTGGQLVTITGAGFSSVTKVTFGGLPAASARFVSDSTLTVTTPAHAEGKVDVVVGDTSTAALSGGYTYTCWGAVPYRLFFMVILSGAMGGTLHALRSLFWYVGHRDLRWSWLLMYLLLPISGASIAIIFFLVAYAGLYTVQGTGSFILVGLGALVGMFSAQAAEKLRKIAEGLLTSAPQGANTVAPRPPGQSAQPAAITVTSVAPPSGSIAGGTQVTINGTGFSGVTAVTFDGLPATTVLAATDTAMTATTPAHAAAVVDVVVGGGPTAGTLPHGYTYV